MKDRYYRLFEILLGTLFLGAGLNGLLVLFHIDPVFPTSLQAMEFLGTGYLLALVKTMETLCGLLLLIRRFVPLAIAGLSPIIANIVSFHIFVDHAFLPLAMFIILLWVPLLWGYRSNFIPLFIKINQPQR